MVSLELFHSVRIQIKSHTRACDISGRSDTGISFDIAFERPNYSAVLISDFALRKRLNLDYGIIYGILNHYKMPSSLYPIFTQNYNQSTPKSVL